MQLPAKTLYSNAGSPRVDNLLVVLWFRMPCLMETTAICENRRQWQSGRRTVHLERSGSPAALESWRPDRDGLVMFVDPTKTPDVWLPPMKRFFEDLRARRAAVSRRSPTPPVAIVVPKIYLLLQHSASTIGDASRLEGFIHAMRGAGPMNEATTLETIGRRCD
jgi:hypothetical protein